MGLTGLYVGLFPVVMINAVIYRVANLARLLSALFTVILLRKRSGSSQGDGETTSGSMWAPVVEQDLRSGSSIMDPLEKIIEEIRLSLSCSLFNPSSVEDPCKGCAVCLNEFKVGERVVDLPRCCHIFHRGCLSSWLDRHQTTCPLCRSSLLTEELSRRLEDHEEEVADAWWFENHARNSTLYYE